ncbi:twin-arginine translocation signal domain-containing protein [Haloarcula rubripromontorii]|uniref:Twin-arginine translocation signal domain-containing protein n=1 Tax=Haloarcula rubripromontorii TaxID=1705562 RepID=A0A0N0BQ63_9EURY|nr:twin-arginine translocation signal domain-containing protein [Haloarcula rubripromontorii]KOX94773.1 hypothetical protein AMS69_02620 [Haloarcula rubripromontorii]NLV07731.1 twin-arginine translocation signal domain-containing protein [Haloarcula rubripromontorii]
MSEDGSRDDSLSIDRRNALKMLGTAGVAVAGTGLGSVAFSGNSAAATVDIGATNPSSVTNDRGDLSKVTIDPTFRVEWENLDTAVGKVFYVIEGRTRDNGNWSDWSPVFRSTPWLTPGSLQGADASKPGTTGYLEFSDPLSAIMNRSSASRDNDNPSPGFGSTGKAEDPRPLPRPIEVVNELGRPDYENADYSDINGVDASSYLAGNSMGGANSAYSNLDSGELSRTEGGAVEYGDSSLDDNGGTLPLVNNFPGAESGYYGAAGDTSRFDVDEDGASDTDTVEIRYTFALQTLTESDIPYFTGSDFDDNYSTVETAIREDSWLENVRPEDVNTGNSELVMDGTDGYPSITNNGANSAASNVYDAYQAIADSHPAVISTTAQFTVTVMNEAGDSGVTGDTSAGASGGGQ